MPKTKLIELIESEVTSNENMNFSRLAEIVGVHRTTMSHFISGKAYRNMDFRSNMARGLARYLSTTPEEVTRLHQELPESEQLSFLDGLSVEIEGDYVPNISLSGAQLEYMARFARAKRAPIQLSLLLILLKKS